MYARLYSNKMKNAIEIVDYIGCGGRHSLHERQFCNRSRTHENVFKEQALETGHFCICRAEGVGEVCNYTSQNDGFSNEHFPHGIAIKIKLFEPYVVLGRLKIWELDVEAPNSMKKKVETQITNWIFLLFSSWVHCIALEIQPKTFFSFIFQNVDVHGDVYWKQVFLQHRVMLTQPHRQIPNCLLLTHMNSGCQTQGKYLHFSHNIRFYYDVWNTMGKVFFPFPFLPCCSLYGLICMNEYHL